MRATVIGILFILTREIVANALDCRVVGTFDTPDEATKVVVRGEYAYVADYRGGVRVISLTTLSSPSEVGAFDTPGFALDIALLDTFLFCADYMALRIVSVANPENPYQIGFANVSGSALAVEVKDTVAVVACADSGLRLISIANPAQPTEIGACAEGMYVADAVVDGAYAYLACGNWGLAVVSIADPHNPVVVGSCALGDFARAVAFADGKIYVGTLIAGLQIVSVEDPRNPVRIAAVEYQNPVFGITMRNDTAYVAVSGMGFSVVWFGRVLSYPRVLGGCKTRGVCKGIALLGNYVVIADGMEGLSVIEYVPARVSEKIPRSQEKGFSTRGIGFSKVPRGVDLSGRWVERAKRGSGRQLRAIAPVPGEKTAYNARE